MEGSASWAELARGLSATRGMRHAEPRQAVFNRTQPEEGRLLARDSQARSAGGQIPEIPVLERMGYA
jgi:hypothetical protein